MSTALEQILQPIANNNKLTLTVKGTPTRSCPTGSQLMGHPSLVGGSFPHFCQSNDLQIGITASHNAGPLLASISTCSKLCAFLSAGPGWKSTP